MEGFDPRTNFGYETSKRYDDAETRGDEQETVAFLAGLAGQGEALEFAIGTGRIALPLTHAGVQVDGIEQSRHMVHRMREKAGGEDVHVVIGDMARTSMGRKYGLVYLVYNTIGNLLTEDDQVRCFENAARHMTDDGVFVLECRVPTAPVRLGHQFVNAERLVRRAVHRVELAPRQRLRARQPRQ
jgi:SAM-dependent methyltransferase